MMKKIEIKKTKQTNSVDIYLSRFGIGEEKEYFLENLSMLLSSGIDVSAAIAAITEGTKSKGMKIILGIIAEEINSGASLWRALDAAKIFPQSTISLVRLGEESGQLVENLDIIIMRQRKGKSFKSKIRSAMMYPILVLFLAFVIGTGIAWFILPRLAKVFSELDLKLPLVTRVLISVGKFIEIYGSIAIPTFIFFCLVSFYFIFIFSKTKFIGEWIIFKIPVIKDLIMGIELSRFGYMIGTLLKTGMPLIGIIQTLEETAGFLTYKKMYVNLGASIEEGNSFQKSFTLYPIFSKLIPLPQQHMIIAAERSGKLEATFLRIGEIYEEKTDAMTRNMSVLLEPVMLVIVWLAVVFIALAVILPIYSLVGGINQNSGSGVVQNQAESVTTENSLLQPEAAVQAEENTGNLSQTEGENSESNTENEENIILQEIKILNTGTGYLNVRQENNVKSAVVAKVKPDEIFEYTKKEGEWYEIKLKDGTVGWVNEKYVEVLEN